MLSVVGADRVVGCGIEMRYNFRAFVDNGGARLDGVARETDLACMSHSCMLFVELDMYLFSAMRISAQPNLQIFPFLLRLLRLFFASFFIPFLDCLCHVYDKTTK
jgi:hypothetical protein